MASKVRLDLSIPTSAATFRAKCKLITGLSQQSFQNVAKYFEAMGGSSYAGDCMVNSGAIQAVATLTSTGTASNNETASVANVTLTAKTSGAVPANGEFNISGTVATQAANIALAINSVPALAGIVTATSALGVTTITAVVPGIMGNGLQLSESLTNVTASAFAGGSDGTAVRIYSGYKAS